MIKFVAVTLLSVTSAVSAMGSIESAAVTLPDNISIVSTNDRAAIIADGKLRVGAGTQLLEVALNGTDEATYLMFDAELGQQYQLQDNGGKLSLSRSGQAVNAEQFTETEFEVTFFSHLWY
ncbi:DUF3581 domain-containing protein [Ferrimonas lipolytica]|uniref:DUF3581 domain-containing protein n=1 Tax=Ferrimonas lipolytica TaxID=2724191 RepID=A0A6H1UEI9_9GAMM|nr:DUF3581 domain-containing protein [Ferrimonas lipolytica]QIZ77010.1 DUF3581 domain-containing protein [Ferrimonas lipolytica]